MKKDLDEKNEERRLGILRALAAIISEATDAMLEFGAGGEIKGGWNCLREIREQADRAIKGKGKEG